MYVKCVQGADARPVETKRPMESNPHKDPKLPLEAVRCRVQAIEDSVNALEKKLDQSRSLISELLKQEDNLRNQHTTLIKATARLQKVLLRFSKHVTDNHDYRLC